MELLVIILNKVDKLDELLVEFVNAGIKGATILDSIGMVRELTKEDSNNINLFDSIKFFINDKKPFNKTVFVVLKQEQVHIAINLVKKVLGDLSKPDVGILFTIPVNYVEGVSVNDDVK